MKYKIGQKYNNFLIVDKDKNNKNKLLCKCDMCGYITSKYKNNIARRGCGVCCKQIIINGYNDALTTNPELKKYVIDEKEFLIMLQFLIIKSMQNALIVEMLKLQP